MFDLFDRLFSLGPPKSPEQADTEKSYGRAVKEGAAGRGHFEVNAHGVFGWLIPDQLKSSEHEARIAGLRKGHRESSSQKSPEPLTAGGGGGGGGGDWIVLIFVVPLLVLLGPIAILSKMFSSKNAEGDTDPRTGSSSISRRIIGIVLLSIFAIGSGAFVEECSISLDQPTPAAAFIMPVALYVLWGLVFLLGGIKLLFFSPVGSTAWRATGAATIVLFAVGLIVAANIFLSARAVRGDANSPTEFQIQTRFGSMHVRLLHTFVDQHGLELAFQVSAGDHDDVLLYEPPGGTRRKRNVFGGAMAVDAEFEEPYIQDNTGKKLYSTTGLVGGRQASFNDYNFVRSIRFRPKDQVVLTCRFPPISKVASSIAFVSPRIDGWQGGWQVSRIKLR